MEILPFYFPITDSFGKTQRPWLLKFTVNKGNWELENNENTQLQKYDKNK